MKEKEFPNGFLPIDKRLTFCKLSLKEIGMYVLLESLPPTFTISVSGLSTIVKDGKKSITSAIKEAEKDGIIEKTKRHKENGQYVYEYKTRIPP